MALTPGNHSTAPFLWPGQGRSRVSILYSIVPKECSTKLYKEFCTARRESVILPEKIPPGSGYGRRSAPSGLLSIHTTQPAVILQGGRKFYRQTKVFTSRPCSKDRPAEMQNAPGRPQRAGIRARKSQTVSWRAACSRCRRSHWYFSAAAIKPLNSG